MTTVLEESRIGTLCTYVPLMKKVEFVDYAAQRCFDQMQVTLGVDEPLAPMYKENVHLPSRYLMGAFLRLYLKEEYDPVEGDEWLMSADDYDRCAAADLMGQLKRFSLGKNGPNKTAALCVLQDYRDLEKRFYREIDSLLRVMNDPIARFLQTIQAHTDPENLQKAKAELENLKTQFEDYQANRPNLEVLGKEEGESGRDQS